jgi:PhnB protein
MKSWPIRSSSLNRLYTLSAHLPGNASWRLCCRVRLGWASAQEKWSARRTQEQAAMRRKRTDISPKITQNNLPTFAAYPNYQSFMELSVYLHFNGDCEAAMNFYCQALGAEMRMMQRFGESPMPASEAWKEKIMHCTIEKDGFMLMGSDSMEGQTVSFGNNYSISLNFHSDAEIDAAFAALSDGGQVTMPLQDTFWGAKFGMCVDRFGVNWMFNFDRPQS